MTLTDLEEFQGLVTKYGLDYQPIAGYTGKGWLPLIEDLIINLKALGWNGYIAQVKQKFGSLRFYVGTGTNAEMHALISQAETKSRNICEVCGEPGSTGTWGSRGYVATRCGLHGEELYKHNTKTR